MKILHVYNNSYATGCCYEGELIFIYEGNKLAPTNFGTDILNSLIEHNGFKPRKPYENIKC